MANNKLINILNKNNIPAEAVKTTVSDLDKKLSGEEEFKASEMISITCLINSVSGRNYTLQDIFA